MALPPASLPPVSARETLPLERLVLDAGTQVRAAIKPRVVELYARALAHGDRFPRVVVFRVDGRDVLSDGFHRVYASRRARRSTIEADVRNGTLDDALWFALGATRASGARAHPGDKRCALEIAYRAWPGVQAVRLAAHVGCGASYANTVRAEVVGGRPDSSVVSGSHPSPRSVSTCSWRLDGCGSRQCADARLSRPSGPAGHRFRVFFASSRKAFVRNRRCGVGVECRSLFRFCGRAAQWTRFAASPPSSCALARVRARCSPFPSFRRFGLGSDSAWLLHRGPEGRGAVRLD